MIYVAAVPIASQLKFGVVICECRGQLYIQSMKERLGWQRWIFRCSMCGRYFAQWNNIGRQKEAPGDGKN